MRTFFYGFMVFLDFGAVTALLLSFKRIVEVIVTSGEPHFIFVCGSVYGGVIGVLATMGMVNIGIVFKRLFYPDKPAAVPTQEFPPIPASHR